MSCATTSVTLQYPPLHTRLVRAIYHSRSFAAKCFKVFLLLFVFSFSRTSPLMPLIYVVLLQQVCACDISSAANEAVNQCVTCALCQRIECLVLCVAYKLICLSCLGVRGEHWGKCAVNHNYTRRLLIIVCGIQKLALFIFVSAQVAFAIVVFEHFCAQKLQSIQKKGFCI